MERKLSYLKSVLFLLFCKLENDPEKAGTEIGKCIREALFDVYPEGRFTDGIQALRANWFAPFVKALLKEIKETRTIINGE